VTYFPRIAYSRTIKNAARVRPAGSGRGLVGTKEEEKNLKGSEHKHQKKSTKKLKTSTLLINTRGETLETKSTEGW